MDPIQFKTFFKNERIEKNFGWHCSDFWLNIKQTNISNCLFPQNRKENKME